jgi:hypothetical protein
MRTSYRTRGEENMNRRLLFSTRHIGFILLLAGSWLFFDIASTTAIGITRRGWKFCLPFFIACCDSGHWTLMADLAVAIILVGGLLIDRRTIAFRRGLSLLDIQVRTKDFLKTLGIAVLIGTVLILALVVLDPLKALWG